MTAAAPRPLRPPVLAHLRTRRRHGGVALALVALAATFAPGGGPSSAVAASAQGVNAADSTARPGLDATAAGAGSGDRRPSGALDAPPPGIAIAGADDALVVRDSWAWPTPLPIRVIAPFRAPATPYASGHRGVDLRADPGETIVAPSSGVVSFAGMVAGRPVVSLDHGDGVVSSMEPVSATVAIGDRVGMGEQLGIVGTGGHCDGCVHLGVRVDGEYVSPMLFLGGVPWAVLLPLA
ncbi:M23 family metallopeptidase [Agromyces sp. Marseille-Q5079]|uniref:M23 family metallopeptidase n=1 Tax=Agromyces sp. Marseille-Q5079 TaxID=3439059 RepID=UPI003D9CB85B